MAVYSGGPCPKDLLLESKRTGFSDVQIGRVLATDEATVRRLRKNNGIAPCVKQIDTLAGEYPAQTNYLYLTYDANENDVEFEPGSKNVLLLGSGTYRIGSSVEFDWCCVNASRTLRKLGYRSILVNYNPETVSTDYDVCDRLYFDNIDLETLLSIYERERCIGVIVSVGGQIPNNLALRLHEAGMRVLGTSPLDIDRAEDRHKFSTLLDTIGVDQPAWSELSSFEAASSFADTIGYPVLIRPSYVLSGAAMGVATTPQELQAFLGKAAEVSPEHPVVLSKFYENTREIEVDAVAAYGHIVTLAVIEHVENAGVHSGDATLVIPPQRTYLETMRRIRAITAKIAEALAITGPFNVQYLSKGTDVLVIECNLRASRSFPFVSKIYKKNLIDLAVTAMLGELKEFTEVPLFDLDYVGVKAPQFSFTRLQGADPTLGVEMASTGEVGCLGDDFNESFLKALLSVGFRFPLKSVLLSTGPLVDKLAFLESARLLENLGVQLYATPGTAEFLASYDIEATTVYWPSDGQSPNAGELLEKKMVDLVINIPKNYQETELTNDYSIRRKAVDYGIPLLTNIQLANRLAEALSRKTMPDLKNQGTAGIRMINIRPAGKNLTLLLASILLMLVPLEAGVRLIEPREVMRYFFMSPDSALSHRFIPGAQGRYKTTEFDVEYSINSLGLRDREITLAKPQGVKRILMLGDSFTEGDGVRAEETFSSQLQTMIDTAFTNPQWQVINAGVGSYSSLLEYLYLTRKGLQLEPDVVILNFDLSDVYDDINYTQLARFDDRGVPVAVAAEPEQRASNWVEASLIGIKDFCKEHFRIYNFTRLRINRFLEGARRDMNISGDVRYDKYAFLRPEYVPKDSDWQLTFRYLLMIRDTLKANGVEFWVTVYPYGLQVGPMEWSSGRQFWGFRPDTVYSTRPQETMAGFCSSNGIPVINMCNDFMVVHQTVSPLYLDYNGHWEPEGHTVAARRLFRSLVQHIRGAVPL